MAHHIIAQGGTSPAGVGLHLEVQSAGGERTGLSAPGTEAEDSVSCGGVGDESVAPVADDALLLPWVSRPRHTHWLFVFMLWSLLIIWAAFYKPRQ